MGAVIVGIGGGLLFFAVSDDGSPSTPPAPPPTSESLQLGAPLPLIEPDDAQQVMVSVTEAAGNQLLIGSTTGDIFVAPLPSKAESVTIPAEPIATLSERVSDLALSADGDLGAAISVVDGSFVLVSVEEDLPASGVIETEYSGVSISLDGRLVALAGFGVATLELNSETPPTYYTQPMLDGGRGTYEDVAFGATGAVAAASVEGVDVWPLGSRSTDGATRSCHCAARGLRLSDDGRHALFGTADGHLVVMDVETGDVLVDRTVSAQPSDIVWAVDFSADGTLAAAVSSGGEGLIWDLDADAAAWRGRVPLESVARIYFTPKGDALVLEASGDDSSSTGVWWAPLGAGAS